MYNLTVTTHFEKEKSWCFVEYLFAEQMYELAKTCLDCASAIIMDCMSGEIIVEWSYDKGEKHWSCREDEWVE